MGIDFSKTLFYQKMVTNNNAVQQAPIGLWEILVPTKFEDTGKPVSKRHHNKWDEYVTKITGGLTVFKPTTKGEWVHKGDTYRDRTIPVRLTCSRWDIELICEFTRKHYRQKAILAYKLSDEVIFWLDKSEISATI